ncbi:MAG: hypothetical protein JXR76_27440 [Deltaproteobacteria bacterium]|nr:hypothetical protein [Deltaproteobacteria bacterium]
MSFAYVMFFVPLGAHTLYQHLRKISDTEEAQELRNGIKEKAQLVTSDVVDSVPELKEVDDKVNAVRQAVHTPSKKSAESVPAPQKNERAKSQESRPASAVSGEDRAALKKLLQSKLD